MLFANSKQFGNKFSAAKKPVHLASDVKFCTLMFANVGKKNAFAFILVNSGWLQVMPTVLNN